jgi:hypothetical protein
MSGRLANRAAHFVDGFPLTVGAWMAEERPYSLLIRLGVILAPILAGVLLWS